MTEYGRGAWPSTGTGGTLRGTAASGTIPGPYYMLSTDPSNQIGLKTWCKRYEGKPVEPNYSATFHAVVGIQLLCNSFAGSQLSGDGIFGPETDKAVRTYQSKSGLVADGVVGQKTMKAFLTPLIKAKAGASSVDWRAPFGILQYEGGWDPGAIGYLDQNDWGLAQINSHAHPHVSFAQAFCPSFAVQFVVDYLRLALDTFNNDIRLAVASYNLGIGGTRQWISLGSPDVWTPSWSRVERNTKQYIDRILNAHTL